MMASSPLPPRRWLLEGTGAAFHFQHVLTASTATYVECGMTNLCTVLFAYEPRLIARLLGVVLRPHTLTV